MPFKNVIFLLFFSVPALGFGQSTASAQVKIFELEAPQLDTVRTVRVYLPIGYEVSKERYPVLYMHDAQNLFDTTTAFVGEWLVDEFLDAQKERKVIVVGIDHGDEKRIAELTPFPNSKHGGGEGAAYINFLVNTLKPHIDNNYRSLTGAENTGIMGSSLGGLISFYAAVKYPEIFGVAGVFSPSFWFSDEIYAFTTASEIKSTSRFYFLAGTSEGEDMVPDIQRMITLLHEKGLPQENLKVKVIEGGEHNEGFWSSEFPEAFQWLFPQKKQVR